MMNDPKKSDLTEVALKAMNKTAPAAVAESVERRVRAEGNTNQQSTHRTQCRARVSQGFERVVKPRLRGEAYLIRYIDDFVMCFQYREDAERVQVVLSKRLNKFALALEPSKTKLIRFGRSAQREARAVRKRPETFSFLGFVHYCTRNRKGNFKLRRKTEKSRLRRSIARLTELMREIRHWSLKEQADAINQVLRGHYAYYGLAGNLQSIRKVYCRVARYWYKMLCSRSWRGSFTWEVFNRVLARFPLQRPQLRLTYGQLQSHAVL